jgi:endonuclease/exonuclease/phosphatase family metal-dependent hydrolase
VATWNVRNFGASNSASIQTDNVITVLRTLKPDLIAIQELKTKSVLDDIVEALPMYDYVFAEYISTGSNVSLGFIYSPDLIEPIYSGAIDNLDQSLDNSAFFSNAAGRIPLAFQFELRKGDGERTITAINIHGKANTGTTSQQTDSYNKRKNMAEALYGSIVNNERSWGYVILLGDYNDDLDKSIFQSRDTPYLSFVNDDQTFWPVTLTLSEDGVRSMTRYSDIIDHITATRRFQDFQSSSDEDIRVHRPDEYLPGNYEDTSDHFPVAASFDMNVTNTSLENGPDLLFPNQIALFPAYPNPFNPETRLTFRISSAQEVKISVFDITGRFIETISQEVFATGTHNVTFNGQGLSTGVYIVAFETKEFKTHQQITLIK